MITKRVANHRSERLRGLDNEKMYKLTRAVIAVVFDFVEKDRRKERPPLEGGQATAKMPGKRLFLIIHYI